MKIVVPGIPIAQARLRHYDFNGSVKTYDPTSREKKRIKGILEKQSIDYHFQFPFVTFLFHMPIPKSLTKRDRDFYESGVHKHVKKPDVDNLIKSFLDCLDGIFFDGDQKVSLGPCIKLYHPEPKTIIWIQESKPVLEGWEFPHEYVSEL